MDARSSGDAVSANPTLTRWNTLHAATATAEILPCCGSRNWANSLAAERPFDGLSALLRASDRIWRELSEADWLEAFACHPRIGSCKSATHASHQAATWSKQEQSSTQTAPDQTLSHLAALNAQYEDCFDFTYIDRKSVV